jgi:hypothetical protein
VLSVMLDMMVIALTVDLFASINSNIITCMYLANF